MALLQQLQCYNKGCGKKFTEDENSEDCCVYHPGEPVFHDAMKGWSCCNRKSTDFTQFLNTPGCTKGKHNSVKPVEPQKTKQEPLSSGQVIQVKAPEIRKPKQPMERPSDDIPFKSVKVTVSNSLKSSLARLKLQDQQQSTEKEDGKGDGPIEIGTKCKNNSCSMEYTGPESCLSDCRHHPGVAIFHEGYKFWTCCQKRTSDFNEFMKQEGCKTGEHVWREEAKKISCRYDWHQTNSSVVISVYAKCILPEESSIIANPTNLNVTLKFEGGKKEFSNSWKLGGVIDTDKTVVELLGTKAEIKLRKAEFVSWSSLQLKQNEK